MLTVSVGKGIKVVKYRGSPSSASDGLSFQVEICGFQWFLHTSGFGLSSSNVFQTKDQSNHGTYNTLTGEVGRSQDNN